MSLFFDPAKCTGCQACRMACMDQWDSRPMAGEAPLCRVETVEGETLSFRFVRCVQCGKCERVCAAGALFRETSGTIGVHPEKCTGCGACLEACPLGVITLDAATGAVKKCDECMDRRAAGYPPACVHTCPTGALIWKEETP